MESALWKVVGRVESLERRVGHVEWIWRVQWRVDGVERGAWRRASGE